MQLAETNPEMTFETIQNELMIQEKEVESFIIDGETQLNVFRIPKLLGSLWLTLFSCISFAQKVT